MSDEVSNPARVFKTAWFTKKDRDNIDAAELAAFRALADLYAEKSDGDIEKELKVGAITEICHGDEA